MAIPPGSRFVAAAVTGALLAALPLSLATSTSAAASTAHPAVHVPRTYFGLHDGSMQAYDHLPFGALRLWDAGVTWRDLETAPGVYDWSRLDTLVSAAQQHHVQVTLVLGMTPSFYADQPSLPPTDLAAFEQYVRAVMTRYRDFDGRRGIASYQVWNEGNIGYFWSGTPAQLASLTAIVDRVRDEVDPGATVVAPSFAVRLPYQRVWMSLYQRQQVSGLPVWRHYDVNALSLYPRARYGERIGGPEDGIHLLTRARHVLAQDGVPRRKKIWATEVNYGVTGGGLGDAAATPISQRRQVANVLRTYLLGAANGLSRIFWYRYDWKRIAGGGTLGNTLLSDPDDFTRIRAAGIAMRIAERWLRGRLIGRNGHRPCARSHWTYACTVRYRGVTRTIYWNPRHHVRLRLPHAGARVQVAGKDVSRVRTGTVRIGFQPVVVRTRH